MKLKDFKLSDKMVKIALFAGVLLIALLFLSSLMKPTQEKKSDVSDSDFSLEKEYSMSADEYKSMLEENMKGLLQSIDGVGAVRIFITLKSGFENIYVTEESIDLDTVGEEARKSSSEKKVLLVENESGRKTALLKKTLNPVVGGVLVVCEGGDNPLVIKNVTEALKASLGINMTQLCVKPLKNLNKSG